MGQREPLVIAVKLEAQEVLAAIHAVPDTQAVIPVLNHMGPLSMAMLLYGRFVAHASDRRLALFLTLMAAVSILMVLALRGFHNTLATALASIWLQEQGDDTIKFSFDESGVEITSPKKKRACANLIRQVETPHAFVIWCPLAAVLPKRCLDDHQVVTLRSWLEGVPNVAPDPHARARLISWLKIWVVIAALAWIAFQLIAN